MPSIMSIKFNAPDLPDIEVLSWSHGFVQPTSATRSTAGSGTVEQVTHQNFTFTRYVDATTNELLKANWSGRQFQKATLSCFRADRGRQVKYLEVAMEHVVIANYSVSGGPGGLPVENVSLDYGIVHYIYNERKVTHDLERRTVS